MMPLPTPQSWTRPSTTNPNITYLLSTDHSLVDLSALSSAFASDLLYWAKPLSPSQLRLCANQSLCLGLYGTDDGKTPREMIGFARLVTDYVTFGYLTDVYVLPEHQGQGLAKWMMTCLDEVLCQWPDLRRCLLFTRDKAPAKMYAQTCKFREIGGNGKLIMMERGGPGTGWKFDGTKDE
ncbi:N-acetyltransferase [Cladorrhinum sp. PSN332]|nr:N-acetyltransferase [Cladorrhinum sp. PSN332]